jgi:putative membrane protein
VQNPGSPYGGTYGGQYSGGYPQGSRRRPYRWIFLALAVVVVVVLVVLLLVVLFPSTFGYSTSHPFGFGPFGFFGAFFLIFIVIMIVSIVLRIAMWGSRGRGYRQGGGGRRYGAFAIARERYAKGEITREQYDQIMQDLQRRPGYPPPP